MKPSDFVNEDSLIRFVQQEFQSGDKTILGIGDDCAALALKPNKSLLVTTDTLVEATHFNLNTISAIKLGNKAVAVNLSDIAAMGANPIAILMSLSLPKKVQQTWLENFFLGVKSQLKLYGVDLVGGDTVGSDLGLSITITALGEANADQIKKRSTANNGDIICVTKTLGDSALGFLALQNQSADTGLNEVKQRHLTPRAEVTAGIWLGKQSEVTAMMDLSDGLKLDLEKLCVASGCGAKIDFNKLPISESAKRASIIHNRKAHDMAISGGEDYALLFTVSANYFEHFKEKYETQLKRPLYQIGKITNDENVCFMRDDLPIENINYSFQHF